MTALAHVFKGQNKLASGECPFHYVTMTTSFVFAVLIHRTSKERLVSSCEQLW